MSRWPEFFIVGAGRAGTTSLFNYLRGHPDIFLPTIKEPTFFTQANPGTYGGSRRSRYEPTKVIRKQEEYLRLFRRARPNQVVGEASTFYLADASTPLCINRQIPHAKIIILLREPVDRAYSAYLGATKGGMEQKASFYDALLEDYEYLQESSGDGSVYILHGLYYEHVKRYLNVFGRPQVRVYLYEDLVSDVARLVREICGFLGVPFRDGTFFDASERYNSYYEARHPFLGKFLSIRTVRSLAVSYIPSSLRGRLRRWLVNRQQLKPPIDPQAQVFLRSIYHDDILKLEELIGRDLSGWLAKHS